MFSKKTCLLSVAVLLTLLLSPASHAAGVQAVITTTLNNNSGDGSENYSLFLNDVPLANLESQTITLGVGDVFRAEVNTTATTADFIGTFSRGVSVELDLEAGTEAASITSTLQGVVNASPTTSQASVFGEVVCIFTTDGCRAPGLPGSIAFGSGALSSTLGILDNELRFDNVTTKTGNTGGEESIDHDVLLELTRSLGNPVASTSITSVSQAISAATASANGTLLVTVTSATVVPVPAAVWLFGSALGLLGWMRRRGRA